MTNSSLTDSWSCIIQPSGNDQWKIKTISIIYCVSSSLSIIGAGSIILSSLSRRVVRNPEVRPLFHLAIGDFLLSFTWLIGAALWLSIDDKHMIVQTCFYIDAIAEIFHVATFLLTVNYAINVYIRLKERTYSIQNLYFTTVSTNQYYIWVFRILYVCCWSIPIILMVPLITKYHANSDPLCARCLLLFDRPRASTNDDKFIWKVYGSIMLASSLSLSIIALMVLYFMSDRLYKKSVLRLGILTDRQRRSIDDMRNRIFLYIMIFLLCWGPALIVASADLDGDVRESSRNPRLLQRMFPLFIVQGLTAPMQGFLNSIVYGWTRRSFRDAANQRLLGLESESFEGSAGYGSMEGL